MEDIQFYLNNSEDISAPRKYMNGHKGKCHIVFAVFGNQPSPLWNKLVEFSGIFTEQSRCHVGEKLICNSGLNDKSAETPTGFTELSTSNRFNDWSAYATGLEKIVNDGCFIDGDIVVIANQTLFTKYPWRWASKKIGLYSKYLHTSKPSVCGFRDSYGFLIDHHPIGGNSGYVTCFCAALNYRAATILIDNNKKANSNIKIDDCIDFSCFDDSYFDNRIKQFCKFFVTSRETHFKWTRNQQSTDKSFLARKAYALALEQELSARVTIEEGFLIDTSHELRSKILFLITRKLLQILR